MNQKLDMAAPVEQDLAVPQDLGPLDMAIPNDASRPVLYSQFATDYAMAICAHLVQCGRVDSDATSLAACREVNALHFGRDFDSEIMRGHLVVNELQCLDTIANSRCDGSDNGFVQQQCVTFLFQPQQQLGQACLSSEECIDGYCLHALNDGGSDFQFPGCEGVCTAYKTTGACDEPDSCNLAAGICPPVALASRMCFALTQPGASCSSQLCTRGYFCPTFGSAKVCTAPAMQMMTGGTCDPQQGQLTNTPPCAVGLYCKYDSATPTTATCQPKVAANGACDTSLYFKDGTNPCVDGYFCDKSSSTDMEGGTGACHPYGGNGSPCVPPVHASAPENDPDGCKINFYCDETQKKCLPLLADGQGCTLSSTCLAYEPNDYSQAGYTCLADNPDAGAFTTCEQYRNFGASCEPGAQDNECYPAGGFAGAPPTVNTAHCAATKNGGGSCAPKCQ